MRLADIRLQHIQQALDKKPGLKPSSMNVYLAIIKAVLRRSATVWELIERPPHIELHRNTARRIRFITSLEAKKLLGELPEHLRDVVHFSLLTGLRKSNVVGLCWDQVDLERRMAWIHPDQSKSRQSIGVPLNQQALELLRNRAKRVGTGFGPVFTFRDKPIIQINTKAFRRGLAKVGIKNFRWHDLRHTWATWHIQAGTPLYVLQELGGWHSYSMVQRYAHLTGEHLAKFTKNCQLLEMLAENEVS
jgi:integrase